MTSRVALAAAALTGAFAGPRLERLDEAIEPRTETEAYAVQTAVLAGETVAGWKVAPARNGVIRCAPLAASRLLKDGGALPGGLHQPLLEVELAIRLAGDVPVTARREETLAMLGTVCMAFEILDSRFLDRKAVSALSALADLQGNRAFSAAPEGVPWGSVELAEVPLALFSDGEKIVETPGGASSAQVAEAVVWLAGHAAARGMPLRRGQIIITGSRLGPTPLPAGRRLLATGAGIGQASLLQNEHVKSERVNA